MPNMTLLRSLLFCPANRPQMIDRLGQADADAVVVDLEDGTPPSKKAHARSALGDSVARVRASAARCHVFVRVNEPDSALFDEDLAAAAASGADGIVVPKLESATGIQAVERALAAYERDVESPPLELILGLESAAGVERSVDILAASTRACAAYFGAEDFATDVGARRSDEGAEVSYARSRVVVAARMRGVVAIDQAVIDFKDGDRFLADAGHGRDLGYGGKICIHPLQVTIANRIFAPSVEEIEHSRRLLEAFDASLASGHGTIDFEGKMIDVPLVERARQILTLAGRMTSAPIPPDDADAPSVSHSKEER
jgi:citrate lyase subunit beta/citryl-CoA lyase